MQDFFCVYLIFFKSFLWTKISCGSGLLKEIMCSSISASPGTRDFPLNFITFGDVEGYYSIAVF